MLLTCPSCNSKYLVNSADLKPDGRIVRCVKCHFDWFQTPDFNEEEKESISITDTFSPNQHSNLEVKENTKTPVSNLPATYVADQKPSIINTSLFIIIIGVAFFCLWIIKSESYSLVVLVNFYIQEFYFNLKLIINDIAKIIHHILN